MVCSVNFIPTYLRSLDVDPMIKIQAKNAHISIINELMNLKDSENYNVFVNDTLVDYPVITINPYRGKEAEVLANEKIKELNQKYLYSIQLLDSVGKKVLAVNTSGFAKSLETKTDTVNLDFYPADTSKFFNLEAHAEQKISSSVLKNVKTFLKKLGIDVQEVDAIEHSLDPKAMADFTKRIVQYVKGYEATLPEEAAHFLTMLMPKDHPLMQEAMREIVNYPVYQEVLAKYGEAYEGNELKIRHEAVGKLIAQQVNKLGNNTPSSWFYRLIQWIKEKIYGAEQVKDNVYSQLAYRLLNGDMSDLSFENVQDEVLADGLFFNHGKYEKIIERVENMRDSKKKNLYKSIKGMFANFSSLRNELKKVQENYENVSVSMVDKTIQFLKDSIGDMENTTADAVNTFVNTIFQVDFILSELIGEKDAIDQIKDENVRLVKVNNLDRSMNLLVKTIIDNMKMVYYNYMSGNPETDEVMRKISEKADIINNFIKAEYLDIAQEKFKNRFADRYREIKAEHEKQLENLNTALNEAIAQNDEKRVKFLQDKIQREKDVFREKVASDELIERYFTGLGVDSSSFSFLFEAAAMSGNILVNELSSIIKESIYSRFEQLQNILNKSEDALNKFKKASNKSMNNVDEFYEGLIEEVDVFVGLDENGKPIIQKQKALVGEYDLSYMAIEDEFHARIQELNAKIFEEEDPKKAAALKDQRDEIVLERKKWQIENFDMPYKDAYYEADALLDENLSDDPNTVMTVRKLTKDIYKQISLYYEALRRTKDAEEMSRIYDAIDDLNFELKDLKSEYNKTGINLKVAQQLKKYSDRMKDIAEWKVTEESLANHRKYVLELKRQLDSGEIDQQTYDLAYKRSVSVMPKKEFFEIRETLIKELNSYIERSNLASEENSVLRKNISDIFKEIEDAVKKYRDEDGVIDSDMIGEKDEKYNEKTLVDFVKSKQEEIEEIKKELIGMSGLSKSDLEYRSELYELLKTAITRDQKDIVWAEIKELNRKANSNKIPEGTRILILEILDEISSLTVTETTEYYQRRIADELNAIKDNIPDYNKGLAYQFEGITYNYDGNTDKWVSLDNSHTLSNEAVNNSYKDATAQEMLHTTEWFKNNHILRTFYEVDPVTKKKQAVEKFDPIYIWKKSYPSMPEFIEEVPAFRFRERVVKEEFRNDQNAISDVTGRNKPRKGKFVNKNFSKLNAAQKEFLKYMTDLYLGYQESKLPIGKRVGLLLPSIPKGAFDKLVSTNIQDLGKTVSNVKESIKRVFSKTENDEDVTTGRYTDNILGDLPIMFTGKIKAEMQSSNALESILTFVAHVIKYDALKEVKPLADAVKSVVSDPANKPIQNTKKGNVLSSMISAGKRIFISPKDKVKGESVTEKHIEHIIRTSFYNENEFEEIIGNFNFGKNVNNAMRWAAYMMLSGKIMANVKNNVAGKIQMGLVSRLMREKIYKEKNLLFGQTISFKVMKDLMSDYYKVGNHSFYHQLLNKFNAFQGEFFNDYGGKVSATVLRDAVNLRKLLMIPKNTAELEMQIVNAMAVLDSVFIKVGDKNIPLHQAFVLKNGMITPVDGVDPEELKKKVNMGIKRIEYANLVTNGNFDKQNRTYIEKFGLGRMASFMNRYFIPFFQLHYGDTKYNASMNEVTTGLHRTFYRVLVNDIKSGYMPFVGLVNRKKDYTEAEKNAVYTTAYHLGFCISLGMMYSLLGGDEPKKWEKLKRDPNGYWKAQLLNLILSTQIEVETMHPIYGIDNISQKIKSPFPASRLYENLTRLLFNLGFEEEDFYKKDTSIWKKGDPKAIAIIAKLTGIEGPIIEMADPIYRLKLTEKSKFK